MSPGPQLSIFLTTLTNEADRRVPKHFSLEKNSVKRLQPSKGTLFSGVLHIAPNPRTRGDFTHPDRESVTSQTAWRMTESNANYYLLRNQIC